MTNLPEPTLTDAERAHRLAQRYAKADLAGVGELLEAVAADDRMVPTLLAACAQLHRPRPDPEQSVILKQRAAFLIEAFLFSKLGQPSAQIMAELVRSTQKEGHLIAFVYALLQVVHDVVPSFGQHISRFGAEGLRYAQLLADAAVDAADDPRADDHVSAADAAPWLTGDDDPRSWSAGDDDAGT